MTATFSAKVQYLDGIRWQRAVLAGGERLISKYKHLNDINVFPVPDGDTGSNMAGTMKSIMDEVKDSLESSIHTMSQKVANSAIMGARGNSGVILAQFLCGFAEGVVDLKKIYPTDFIKAMDHAWDKAKDSMSTPKPGTILTVMQDWVEHLRENVDNYADFRELLNDSVEKVRQSLAETPKMLACLKEAGVVDAGAQGFLYLLEGVSDFLEKGKITRIQPGEIDFESKASFSDIPEELEFRYCTECIISGENLPPKAVKAALTPMGNSLIVAGTNQLVRLHIHTNTPEQVFRIAQEFGEVSSRKIDDMLAQAQGRQKIETGIITDSTCDLPKKLMDKYNIQQVPLRLFIDGQEYIDKKTITPDEFYEKLKTAKEVHTSQPTPLDFSLGYQHLMEDYKYGLSVHIGATYSGTVQGARTAAAEVSEDIHIADGVHPSIGLSLAVLEGAKALHKGKTAAQAAEITRDAGKRTRILVLLETLEYAVRGGRVSPIKGMMAKLLNIRPILKFDSEGNALPVSSAMGQSAGEKKLLSMVDKACEKRKNPRFAIAHADNAEAAKRVEKYLIEKYDTKDIFIVPASPVVGVHSGPGMVAVAYLGDPE